MQNEKESKELRLLVKRNSIHSQACGQTPSALAQHSPVFLCVLVVLVLYVCARKPTQSFLFSWWRKVPNIHTYSLLFKLYTPSTWHILTNTHTPGIMHKQLLTCSHSSRAMHTKKIRVEEAKEAKREMDETSRGTKWRMDGRGVYSQRDL